MEILISFLLSLIAGSASGIGGLIVYAFGDIDDKLLGFLLGFAGEVMLVVSFLELFVEAIALLTHLEATFAFTGGALLMMIIDLTTRIWRRVGGSPVSPTYGCLKLG